MIFIVWRAEQPEILFFDLLIPVLLEIVSDILVQIARLVNIKILETFLQHGNFLFELFSIVFDGAIIREIILFTQLFLELPHDIFPPLF